MTGLKLLQQAKVVNVEIKLVVFVQVSELLIKRMKQLLKLAQVHGKTALTNEATMLALLLACCLVQPEGTCARQGLSQAVEQWEHAHRQATSVKSIEPLAACLLPTVSSWTITALCVQTLRQHV